MIIDLSVRLRQLRLDKRLRQDQVARLVGVSKGQSRHMRRTYGNPLMMY